MSASIFDMSPSIEADTALLKHARSIAALFDYTNDDVCRCAAKFAKELDLGLCQRMPSMCQIPTYVCRLATGLEKGLSLAVDLGGTNLRVCSVNLHGDTTYTALHSQLAIPRELMVASEARDLFSFIALRIEDFLQTHHQALPEAVRSDPAHPFLSLGFTFSFAAYQTGINSGILLHWTKGFDIPGVVGQDVCKLLQDEIDLLGLPVKVTALVNDAAGAIISRAYSLPVSDVRPTVGTIFGTGTNGVYLQDLTGITKTLDGEFDWSTGKMFMSTEWGGFDNELAVLPVTTYDTELDNHSVNPGSQMFEKRVSGMFLGELLRLAISEIYCNDSFQLFQGSAGITESLLQRRWTVDSSILSVAGTDTSKTLTALRRKIHQAFGIPEENVTAEDAQVVKVIASAIGTRAARLAGMATGAVIIQSRALEQTLAEAASLTDGGQKLVDVAVDGSVVEHYPGFESHMRNAMAALEQIGEAGEKRISIGHAKDGSSVGAAIIALLATK